MKEVRIDREMRGSVDWLRLTGSLDMYSLPRLVALVQARFDQGHYCVVLDCGRLDYIGSAGLGAFIGFSTQARDHNGDFKLLNVPERIFKIISLLGFTKVLHLYTTEQEALASFPPDEIRRHEVA